MELEQVVDVISAPVHRGPKLEGNLVGAANERNGERRTVDAGDQASIKVCRQADLEEAACPAAGSVAQPVLGQAQGRGHGLGRRHQSRRQGHGRHQLPLLLGRFFHKSFHMALSSTCLQAKINPQVVVS
jgi:hypothetical protein